MQSVVYLLLLVNNLCECIDEFFDDEGLTLDLIELVGNKVVDLHAEVGGELTHVLFGHHHLIIFSKHVGRVLRQRVQVLEVRLGHLVALGTQFVHRRVQMAVGRAEAQGRAPGYSQSSAGADASSGRGSQDWWR